MTLLRLLLAALTSGAALLQPALRGDRRAIDGLVERLMPIVRAICRRVIDRRMGRRGPYDGDDLVQEVWLCLMRDDAARLRQWDPARGSSLESYVAMVSRSEASKVLRREQAVKRGGDADIGALEDARGVAGGHDPEAVAVGRSLQADLDSHLAEQLAPKGRLILRLLYTDGLSPPEAARAIGCTTQVVYNWQHKIRSLIRARLAEVQPA